MSERLTHQKFAEYAIKWGAQVSQFRAETRHIMTVATIKSGTALEVQVKFYRGKVYGQVLGFHAADNLNGLTGENLNAMATAILQASDIIKYAKDQGAKEL